MRTETELVLRRRVYRKLDRIDSELKSLITSYYQTVALLLPVERPTKRDIAAINKNAPLTSLEAIKKRLNNVRG